MGGCYFLGAGSGSFQAPCFNSSRLTCATARRSFQRERVWVRPLGDAEIEMADETARRHPGTNRNEARLVITPLLHVASLCIALGIPVILARTNLDA